MVDVHQVVAGVLQVLSHPKMCSGVKSHLAVMAVLRGREACGCLDQRVIGYPLALRELKVLGTHQPWSRQCLKSVLDPLYFFLKNRKWSPEGFLTGERVRRGYTRSAHIQP